MIDDGQPVAKSICFLKIVGSEQDGQLALLPQPDQVAPQGRPRFGVQAGRRLIQKQDRWFVNQTHRNIEPALHAAGVGVHQTVGRLGQPDPFQ